LKIPSLEPKNEVYWEEIRYPIAEISGTHLMPSLHCSGKLFLKGPIDAVKKLMIHTHILAVEGKRKRQRQRVSPLIDKNVVGFLEHTRGTRENRSMV
jgi:hypothetical protein